MSVVPYLICLENDLELTVRRLACHTPQPVDRQGERGQPKQFDIIDRGYKMFEQVKRLER